jgi:phosphoribosyl-ATP pyrophosphohydrolase
LASVNFLYFRPAAARRIRVDRARTPREDTVMTDTLFRLEAVIRDRRTADPDASYVARLRAKGRGKMAQKLGEEAVETVIAALADDRAGLTGEAADLVFHLLVLLADCDVSLADVCAELDRRDGVSGIAEKAARPKE